MLLLLYLTFQTSYSFCIIVASHVGTVNENFAHNLMLLCILRSEYRFTRFSCSNFSLNLNVSFVSVSCEKPFHDRLAKVWISFLTADKYALGYLLC